MERGVGYTPYGGEFRVYFKFETKLLTGYQIIG